MQSISDSFFLKDEDELLKLQRKLGYKEGASTANTRFPMGCRTIREDEDLLVSDTTTFSSGTSPPLSTYIKHADGDDNMKSSKSKLKQNRSPSVFPIQTPSHLFPILIGFLPYLLALLFGHPDTWTEISFLILIFFWLYISLKVPWDMYVTFTTKIEESAQRALKTGPILAESMKKKLIKYATIGLLFISPFVAICGVFFFQQLYNDGRTFRFLPLFNAHLFLLAALISPLRYFLRPSLTYGHSKDAFSRYSYVYDMKQGGPGSTSSIRLSPNLPEWALEINRRLEQLEVRHPCMASSRSSKVEDFNNSLSSSSTDTPFLSDQHVAFNDVMKRIQEMGFKEDQFRKEITSKLQRLESYTVAAPKSEGPAVSRNIVVQMGHGMLFFALWPWIAPIRFFYHTINHLTQRLKNILGW